MRMCNNGFVARLLRAIESQLRGMVCVVYAAAISTPIAIALVSSASAEPNNYPSKPIRIVLGFSAGGGTDALARTLAKSMAAILKANVLIDNKPGANGNIAAEEVVRARADGYTLLYNTSSIASSPSLYKNKLSYDVLKDLIPVGLTATMPMVLVVPVTSQFKLTEELISYAKANPGKLNYSSAGNGNVTHLAALSFEQAVGINSTHIPYKGEAPALVDLMAGQVDYYFATSAGAIPAIKAGRVRALSVGAEKRLETLPEVPTLSDTVARGLHLSAWSGLMAPAGTPQDIVKKLNAALNQSLADPDVKKSFASQSAIGMGTTPEKYGAFLHAQIDSLSKVIQISGFKVD